MSSQRERLLAAMVECVGAEGYAETTVGDVIGRARVSRSAFYRLFENKEDCFRVAYRELTDALVGALAEVGAELAVVEGIKESVRTYLRWCGEWPSGARAWHLGIAALEPDGSELRDQAVDRIVVLFRAGARRARRDLSGLPPAREFLFAGVAHASISLVSRYAREDRLGSLSELEQPIFYLWLLALTDQSTAEVEAAG